MPVSRLLGGNYRQGVQPYCSLLMEPPRQMFDLITSYRMLGFTAFKIGWGPFGRAMDHRLDAAIVPAAREAAGPGAKLMVDAGASDAYWPHRLKWALRTAQMLAEYVLTIPDAPGLGVALDRDEVARYCSDAAPLFGC